MITRPEQGSAAVTSRVSVRAPCRHELSTKSTQNLHLVIANISGRREGKEGKIADGNFFKRETQLMN